jgi:hypothetical protein
MAFLTEMRAENRLTDWRLFEEVKPAEDAYFRGFAAVVQQLPIRRADGELTRLIGCFLYEVPTSDLGLAKAMVKFNEARRLQSTDDGMCGVPVDFDLFRVIH